MAGLWRCPQENRAKQQKDAVLTPAAKPKLPSRIRLWKPNTKHTIYTQQKQWDNVLLPIPAIQENPVLWGKNRSPHATEPTVLG